MAVRIVDSADVADDASIGDGSSVWHLAQVREGAVLGENCVVGRGAYVGTGVQMGDNCKLQNYALVYEPALLEDGVFVGPAVVFTNDHFPRAVSPDGSLKTGDDWEAVGVTCRTGASIGARSVCVAPVTIGRWALVAAGSVVTKDVPDFALVAGVPGQADPLGRQGRRPPGAGRLRHVGLPTDRGPLHRARQHPDGGRRTMTEFIPPAKPLIGDEEREAVDRVLRSGMLAQGPEVKAFEEEFSAHFGLGRACVAVNSGTSGQHLGLLSSGVKAGDEVIVPSFTFAATANSVALTGATPVFADISRRRLLPRPRRRRGRDHRQDGRHHAGPPLRPPGQDGPAHGHRRQARPAGLRGRRPGARRLAERHPCRGVRHLRDVLALPDQEHDVR